MKWFKHFELKGISLDLVGNDENIEPHFQVFYLDVSNLGSIVVDRDSYNEACSVFMYILEHDIGCSVDDLVLNYDLWNYPESIVL